MLRFDAAEDTKHAGARIKFVRVAERDRAKLVIGYGDVGPAAGRATIGPARPAWVRLSNAYRDVDPLPRFNRVAVMAVLAHELGHVLGFGHTEGTWCLVEPVPPALAGLGFTEGGDGPVVVRWTPTTSLPSGTVVQLLDPTRRL